MMDQFKLMKKLTPAMRKGNLDECIDRVAQEMSKGDTTPFHIVLNLDFTNEPEKVARYFDSFIRSESPDLELRAVYTEMNGFSINPDKWYFDAFCYEEHGGLTEFDWLAEYDSSTSRSMTLTGMKPLQKVYDSEAAEEAEDASGICDLMVVLKFQNLIRRSAPLISRLKFPLLATAHEYDFIYQYKPGR